MDPTISSYRQPESAQTPADDEIDLAQLWAILLHGKWLVAGCVAVALVVAVGYLFVTQPVYRADALLQIQADEPPSALKGLMEMMPGGSNLSSEAATQMQILSSRAVLGNVVTEHHLQIRQKPKYFPLFGEALAARGNSEDIAPITQAVDADAGGWLSRHAWGPASIKVTALAMPDDWLGKTLTLRALGAGHYILYGPEGEHILQGRVGETISGQLPGAAGSLQIFVQELETTSPPTDFTLRKQRWLPVVRSLQQNLHVTEKGGSRDSTGIVTISLEGEDRQSITNIVNAVANTFLRQNVKAQSQQAEQSLEFLDEQLPQLQDDLEQAETRLTQYREEYQAVGLDAESKALLDRMVSLEEKRSELILKRDELREKYTARHPQVKALEGQLGSIQRKHDELQQEINELPSSQKQLFGLKRDLEVNTTLYTSLLNRAQELRVVKAGTTGNVRIVDHAVLPVKAVAPQKKLVLALAFVLGGIIGCGIIFLRAALRRTINDPHDIERLLGLPVYATIPFVDWLGKLERRARRNRQPQPLLARDHPQEVATEALRSLRTSLYFARMEAGSNVLLITGPSPEIGKSFVSINLGYLLAEADKKVLLVGADMRLGKLHKVFNQDREPGLSQVLTGQYRPEEVIRQVDNSSMYFMTSGTVPPNPSELLMRPELKQVLAQLKQDYDYVVIDAPPVLAVTDANIIASTMDNIVTFMVVRSGVHPRPELEEAFKRMTQADNRIAGVVFNGLRKEHAEYSGAYGYYQYEYKSQ